MSRQPMSTGIWGIIRLQQLMVTCSSGYCPVDTAGEFISANPAIYLYLCSSLISVVKLYQIL